MTSEVIISLVALAVSGALLINNLYLRIQNKKIFMKAAQAEVDRLAVQQKTQELLQQTENIEAKDGFVKFMSQSREWAFEYIEKVQNDLYELKYVSDSCDGRPKTVAQNNAMAEAVAKVLQNLPDEGKK